MFKTFELTIFNQKFSIRSDEEERHVKKVADMVNRKMNEIAMQNKNLSVVNVAILAAINIADDFLKTRDQQSSQVAAWSEKLSTLLNRLETEDRL